MVRSITVWLVFAPGVLPPCRGLPCCPFAGPLSNNRVLLSWVSLLLYLGSGKSHPLQLHCCDEWVQLYGLTDKFINLVSGSSFTRLRNRSADNTCILISERLELPLYLHWCSLYAHVSAINSVIMTRLNRFVSCSCLASCERKLELVRQNEMRVCQRWCHPEVLTLILPIVLRRNLSSPALLLLLCASVLPVTYI